MLEVESWFNLKVNSLLEIKCPLQKMEVLTELKIKFANLSEKECEQIARKLPFYPVFVQLTSSDGELVEQVCDFLKLILQFSDKVEILCLYSVQTRELLSHKLPIVKIFALKEILLFANDPNALQLLLKDELLVTVVNTVANDNLEIANLAMSILKKIGQSYEGLKILYSKVMLRSLMKVLSLGDIIKFRVYEVIVDVAQNSEIHLTATKKTGFMQGIIGGFNESDIIVKLNTVEVLKKLAVTKLGLDFLEEQGFLEQLQKDITMDCQEPFAYEIVAGIWRFFGSAAHVFPDEILSRYSVFASSLFEVIESENPFALTSALNTLGHVSSTVKGKYALQKLGNAMHSSLKKISEIINKSPSKLRVRGLINLRLILYINKCEQDNRILSLTKSWFDSLNDEPLKMIISLCNQPFSDIRKASLKVLNAISSQEWGQEYIATYPGLIEFLLDRNIESYKKCKEIKFEIVENLSKSVPNIFDNQTMQRFQKFVKEGPFYIATITEVAIDGV